MRKPMTIVIILTVISLLTAMLCISQGIGFENEDGDESLLAGLMDIYDLPSYEPHIFVLDEDKDYSLALNEPFLLDMNEDKVYSAGQHNTLVLDSNEDLLGLDDDFYVAGFDWVGTMEVTLVDVAVYDSMEHAGIDSNDPFFSRDFQDNKEIRFILCTIVLENVDAIPNPSFSKSGYFNISNFGLIIEGGSSSVMPPNEKQLVFYFDGTIPDVSPGQRHYYSIEKGEIRQFRLGFFVDEADYYKPSAICVGSRAAFPACLKYQLRFAITPEMVKSA